MTNGKCKAKLRSRAGESIAETLVALLVSSLALLMLAGAVNAGMRVVTRSNAQMQQYYDADSLVASRAAADPSKEYSTGSVAISITSEDGSISDSFSHIDCYINGTFGGKAMIAYGAAPAP